MSRNVETSTNSNRDIFVEPRKVDLEETLGSAAKREVTPVIASGKASLPTADAVVTFVKGLVEDCESFSDFKTKIENL